MKVIIFWEDDFPFIDTKPLSREALASAFSSEDTVRFLPAHALPAALQKHPDLFVNPYGSAFPRSAWPAFFAYLERGGNWVNLGGAPLSRPVRRRGEAVPRPSIPPAPNLWWVECHQTAYGKKLGINQAFPTDVPSNAVLHCPPLDVDLETHFHRFHPTRVWALQVRFTRTRDFPDEVGSSGPREALLRSLTLAEKNGRVLAAPIVAIDRLSGPFAGGRWVLAACEGNIPLPADLIARLCDYAVRARAQMDVRPSFACYYPGEMAVLNVGVQASFEGDLKINLRVYSRDSQQERYAHIFRARSGVGPAIVQTSPFPVPDPGLYIVRAMVEAEGRNKPIAAVETGFWVYDRDLISSGQPLTVDRDYFYRNGRPYPVTGTTYMAGDTHRKFLFEPNPAVWDADFAAMKAAGVNMVRTGLWTGWKRAMLDPGAIEEGVLRAFTAFLLTARRYDIPVIFTFFSFLPEAWGGENPYLDPKAVAAQTAFVAAFARRFACVNDLLWDFINEPSFSSPARVWRTRPNYDRYERAAWAEWLAAQASEEEWRERWRMTPDEPLDLPPPEDFEDRHVFEGAHPMRAMDYRRFAQEKFAEWAAKMAAVVRENGNPHQLVTVGQDEGGAGERPGPHFYGPAVDFTTNHSWWENDDLLWDSVITKTPDRPNLIEETGVMFLENVDGSPWRTPEECRNLLERKMALSFACGGAGFLQWLWNTNVYMASDIEAGIGLLRADGSEKPEMEAFRGIARFFAENAHRMVGRKLEEICLVIPYSNLFSVRNTADAATRRAVRALEYHLGLPCRTVSEYRAEEIGDARWIVLPAPRVLTESCWQALLKKVEAGATLLVTGFVEADEYGRPMARLEPFGLETKAVPVARDEPYTLHGDAGRHHALYDGHRMQRIERAVLGDGPSPASRLLPHGLGQIYYCALPLELTQDIRSAVCLYSALCHHCGIQTSPAPDGLLVRRLEYGEHTLYLLVNESSAEMRASVSGSTLRVPAGRIGLALVERGSGAVVAKYEVE